MPNQYVMRMELDERRFYQYWRRIGRSVFDFGYLTHGVLMGLLGEHQPHPFFLGPSKGGCLPIEGYVPNSEEELQSYINLFADPELSSMLKPETLRTKKLPTPDQWPEYIGFKTRVNPVHRNGRERDFFFVAQESNPEVTREQAYSEWLRLRFEKSGIELVRATLDDWSIMRACRPHQVADDKGRRQEKTIPLPDATMSGVLKLPADRSNLSVLSEGIGPGKAFGFGMVQLRPATRS